ncbi:hypothetical protein [Streptomyces sp. NPDC007264]|uniref:hypothetical protein n=1 Tax=Streptomyces sp. NPDC007264 TaxID=3364777 RepID=UPI0036DA6470
MPAVPCLPELGVPGGWRTAVESWTRVTGRLRLYGRDMEVGVQVERCAAGRLRDAYPVAARDLELRVGPGCPDGALAEVLRVLVHAVGTSDPRCRRIVHAVPEGDEGAVATAEAAGFRHVVDVDLGEEQLSLLVAEPGRGTAADTDPDRIPGT